MTRRSTPEPEARLDEAVTATAGLIAGKWTLVLLSALADGPRRFGELERAVAGISPHTLTVRLRALEEAGVVVRVSERADDRAAAYALGESGRELLPILDVMRSFGSRWLVG